ncbi:MAG: hypothetical protein HXY20_15210 [Acidobacteria bacterium]|nr:hypothetical protein [Acidobacteriota bacterium]
MKKFVLTGSYPQYSFFTIILCSVLTLAIINFLWTALNLHVPGEPNELIDFTQPVDSIFYVRNAELGYRWDKETPTSLWFHPLVSLGIRLLPSSLPANIRLWLISLLSAFGALIFTYRYTAYISSDSLSPVAAILFMPLIPGVVGVATGNAEFPCLLFNALLLLSVVEERPVYYPILWGALAILTKPNAIYMIPVLGVYLIYAVKSGDWKKKRNSLWGICSIVFVWLVWMIFVDFQVGEFGAYWDVRKISTVPLTAGPLTFLQRATRIFVYGTNEGEMLKFVTALAIPLVDLWIILSIPLKHESHRLSIIAGIVAMILVTFLINNPNKIVVYATTIPGHISIGLLFLQETLINQPKIVSKKWLEGLFRSLAGLSYVTFCVLIIIFYILGTPLEWYY